MPVPVVEDFLAQHGVSVHVYSTHPRDARLHSDFVILLAREAAEYCVVVEGFVLYVRYVPVLRPA